MIFIKKLNVIKKIDESRLSEYEAKGFVHIKDKHPDKEGGKPARFACPHCDKDYATAENLANHIKDKHPDKGE